MLVHIDVRLCEHMALVFSVDHVESIANVLDSLGQSWK